MSRPSPVPCRRAQLLGERPELRHQLLVALLRVVDQVHLVDRHDNLRDAEQRADERVALGLLEHALARVDQHHRRSAVEAPVTMLRVYWRCPGQSAMMKRRLAVAK